MKHLLIVLFLAVSTSLFAQMKNVILADKPVPKPTNRDSEVEAWDSTQTIYQKLNATGKDFFYWINFSRQNPKRFWDTVVQPTLNAFPTLNSSYSESLKSDLYHQPTLPLLKLNNTLMQTASAHAADICSHHAQPGHLSTDGRTFTDRIKAAGIKVCGGENISLGDVDPLLSLVLLYIDYGIPTLGHRKALLNPDYLETGIGVGIYGSDGTLFIVQDFACNQQ